MRIAIAGFALLLACASTWASGTKKPAKDADPTGLHGSEALRRDLDFTPRFKEIDPFGGVLAIREKGSGRFLGSTVRICTHSAAYTHESLGWWHVHDQLIHAQLFKGAPADREFFITAAHVVEKSLAPGVYIDEGQVKELKLEFVASGADLAVYSSPRSKGACIPVAINLQVAGSYDALATFAMPPVALEFESPRVVNKRDIIEAGPVRRWRGSTRVTSTLNYGLPGRDDAGPLLTVLAQAVPGQSGSAIMAQPQIDGALYSTHQGMYKLNGVTLEAVPHHRRLIGMVLAVGKNSKRVAALPGPTIFRYLSAHFLDPQQFPSKPEQVTYAGATQYFDVGAVHFRRGLLDASTGDLNDQATGDLGDGGTGDLGDGGNDLIDIATGDLGDGGTGDLGDGGTGDLGDGGADARRIIDLLRQRKVKNPPAAGLYWKRKLWFSIDNWTEFESFPKALRDTMKKGEKLAGIFSAKDHSLLSTFNAPLPLWLNLPGKDAGPEFSTAFLRADGDQMEGGDSIFGFKDCQRTIGVMGDESTERRRGVQVAYCEEANESTREFFLGLLKDVKAQVPAHYIYGRLQRETCVANSYCELSLKVIDLTDHPHMRDYRYGAGSPELSWRLVQSIARKEIEAGRAVMLKTDGLRVFRGNKKTLALFQNGGYRLRFEREGKVQQLIGPSFLTKNFFVINPDLLAWRELY